MGPVLFLIYVNDIDTAVDSLILKFADDTKLFRQVENAESINQLRADLAKVGTWQMLFNVGKCKVMHI